MRICASRFDKSFNIDLYRSHCFLKKRILEIWNLFQQTKAFKVNVLNYDQDFNRSYFPLKNFELSLFSDFFTCADKDLGLI